MNELEFVTDDELIAELADRHTELIVIREHEKLKDYDSIFVKTPKGELSSKNDTFDLIIANELLSIAQRQLVEDFLMRRKKS